LLKIKGLFLSKRVKTIGRDDLMRSRMVVGALFGLVLIAGCSGTISQHKTTNGGRCDVGSCSVPKPLNPANIDFEVGEGEDHEVMIPVEKVVKHCIDGMVLVDTQYCPNPLFDRPEYDETGIGDPQCEEWMEKPCNLGGTHPSCMFARCKRYKASSTVCPVATVHKVFCMDRYEYTKPGDILPLTMITYHQAANVCSNDGKRLCKETEWETGCMTSANLPYGVTNGLERPTTQCNIDITHNLGGPGGRMRKDLLVPSNSMPNCCNSLGICMLDGNADEWTVRDRSSAPKHSKEVGEFAGSLKGGHYAPIRARCRPATTAHSSSSYYNTVTTFRCCSDTNNR